MFKIRLTELVFKSIKGYTVTEFRDLFLQRNSGRRRIDNIILPTPETNFIRNSIYYRAIVRNSLTNKETRDKTLKEFKRCLAKSDADKVNFEPILTTTKIRDIGYKHFEQFFIFNCTFAFSTRYFSCNCCMHDPTSNVDLLIVLK